MDIIFSFSFFMFDSLRCQLVNGEIMKALHRLGKCSIFRILFFLLILFMTLKHEVRGNQSFQNNICIICSGEWKVDQI